MHSACSSVVHARLRRGSFGPLLFAMVLAWACAAVAREHHEHSGGAGSAPPLTAWEAPQTCIPRAELEARVSDELREVEVPPQRRVLGRVTKGAAGWTVTFQVQDDGAFVGKRVLQLVEEDCRVHDESIVLVVALLLEHGPPEEEAPAESAVHSNEIETNASAPSADPDPPPAVAATPLAADAEVREPSVRPRRVRAGIAAEVLFAWGPRVSLGPRVSVGYALFDRIWLDGVGTFMPPSTQQLTRGQLRTVGGRARLRLCAETFPTTAWSAQACVFGGWRSLWGEGRGVERGDQALLSTAEFGVDVGTSARILDWLFVTADADISCATQRGTFVFESTTRPPTQVRLYRTSRVLSALSLGISARF